MFHVLLIILYRFLLANGGHLHLYNPTAQTYQKQILCVTASLNLATAHDTTGSFSKVVLSQGVVKQVFLGVFLMFLAFFHSKIWAQFHFGTFKPYK